MPYTQFSDSIGNILILDKAHYDGNNLECHASLHLINRDKTFTEQIKFEKIPLIAICEQLESLYESLKEGHCEIVDAQNRHLIQVTMEKHGHVKISGKFSHPPEFLTSVEFELKADQTSLWEFQAGMWRIFQNQEET